MTFRGSDPVCPISLQWPRNKGRRGGPRGNIPAPRASHGMDFFRQPRFSFGARKNHVAGGPAPVPHSKTYHIIMTYVVAALRWLFSAPYRTLVMYECSVLPLGRILKEGGAESFPLLGNEETHHTIHGHLLTVWCVSSFPEGENFKLTSSGPRKLQFWGGSHTLLRS